MADDNQAKTDASAEKAYAAASTSVGKADEPKPSAAAPAAEAAAPGKPAIPAPPVAGAPMPAAAPARAASAPEPATQPAPATKRVQTRAAKVAKQAKVTKSVPSKSAVATSRASGSTARVPEKVPPVAKVPAAAKASVPETTPIPAKPKEISMQTTTDYSENFKKVVSEAQEKAASVFEKSSTMFGEYTEFAKGNVEAIVESGKILGSGLQEMGSTLLNEGKSAVETMTSDVKALSAVKSPTDFFKLQGEIARRNFDSAVALSSKNSEAMLKLVSEVVAPISGRVSLAVEKVKQTA